MCCAYSADSIRDRVAAEAGTVLRSACVDLRSDEAPVRRGADTVLTVRQYRDRLVSSDRVTRGARCEIERAVPVMVNALHLARHADAARSLAVAWETHAARLGYGARLSPRERVHLGPLTVVFFVSKLELLLAAPLLDAVQYVLASIPESR